ncbi:MAG: hypothetical protein WA948_11865 [Pontixanthobacter sp.]
MLTGEVRGRFVIDEVRILIATSDGLPPIMPVFHDGTQIGRDARGVYGVDPETGRRFRDGGVFGGEGVSDDIASLALRGMKRHAVPQNFRDRADPKQIVTIDPGIRPVAESAA